MRVGVVQMGGAAMKPAVPKGSSAGSATPFAAKVADPAGASGAAAGPAAGVAPGAMVEGASAATAAGPSASAATAADPSARATTPADPSASGARESGPAADPSASGGRESGPVARWAAAWRGEEAEAGRLFDRVSAGENLAPADLLRLQMSVGRAALRLEMGTRVVDRALQGVRQLTSMQV